jgi:hypothetical protein
MDPTLFEVIDATGGGCCRLRADQTIAAASRNFVALTGGKDPVGRPPAELLAELPPVAELPSAVGADPVLVRAVGVDGIGRELAVARMSEPGGGGVLVLVDRSGEARVRRNEARLERQIDDLEAKLAARERQPRRPRIRSMAELTVRLDEALMRARRYQHQVTLVAICVAGEALDSPAIGETISNCVRGVDDLGQAGDDRWILALPHTELVGGEVVAKRVQARLSAAKLGAAKLTAVALGVAQVGADETGSAAIERAEQACAQALEAGGGLLLAVAFV